MSTRIASKYGNYAGEIVSTLKPCPFCGSEAEIKIDKHSGGRADYEYAEMVRLKHTLLLLQDCR